jgi:hypothetical protein
MKSSVRSSKFIQPRRFELASQQTHDKSILDALVGDEKISRKSENSPDCVLSMDLSESIADILCNLEQMYDSSFLKWDNIRRSDELEHAMMRGIICLTAETSASSQQQQGDEKTRSFEGAPTHEVIHTDNRCLFMSEEPQQKSESENLTRTKAISGLSTVFDVKSFALLTLLLLFLLRVSYSQRISI